jgi:hypothetical protein
LKLVRRDMTWHEREEFDANLTMFVGTDEYFWCLWFSWFWIQENRLNSYLIRWFVIEGPVFRGTVSLNM